MWVKWDGLVILPCGSWIAKPVVWADTTPPKRPLKVLQQNMIDASFTPGANVYFSYSPSQGNEFPIPWVNATPTRLKYIQFRSSGYIEKIACALLRFARYCDETPHHKCAIMKCNVTWISLQCIWCWWTNWSFEAAAEIPLEGPYLRPEVQELRDLHKLQEAPSDNGLQTLQNPNDVSPTPEAPAKRAASAKSKPKWLKM